MYIIVGLGNSGNQYQHTYHNVGFDCLDYLIPGIELRKNDSFHSYIAKVGDYIFMKPTTFMNLSGKAVYAVMQYYKIPLEQVVVLHDDSDISLGSYKIQVNRGSGGHRGIQSIIQQCGGKQMRRIRIGIRAERFGKDKAHDFVLRKISLEDQYVLDEVYADIQTSFTQDKIINV